MDRSRPKRRANTLRVRARDALLEQITAGKRPAGSRLETVRELARQLGMSTCPVSQALDDLEARGYVERRQGSGITVLGDEKPLSPARAVVLCLRTGGHVYGDLCADLSDRLAKAGMMPTVVDRGRGPEKAREALRRSLAAEAWPIVLQAGLQFPYGELARSARAGRSVVALHEWHDRGDWPNVHRVLIDHALGGRLVADRLAEGGHERALVVGTETMIAGTLGVGPRRLGEPAGSAFARRFAEHGGRVRTLVAEPSATQPLLWFNDEAVRDALKAPDAPTAIFALYDFAAVSLQSHLRAADPAWPAQYEWVGYGNTPWRAATDPLIASVSMNVETVAERAADAVTRLRAGTDPARADPEWVAPRLVETAPSAPEPAGAA